MVTKSVAFPEFGNRRVPIASLKPTFVASSASTLATNAPIISDKSSFTGVMSPVATLPIDSAKMASSAQRSAMLAATYTPEIEEVELFAPLETTDWKKYWPLAAAGVGAIALIMLVRSRKR